MDVRQRQRPSAAQGLPLSLGMHALIGLLLLFFLQPPKQEGPIAEPVVDVELVAPSGAAGVPDRKTFRVSETWKKTIPDVELVLRTNFVRH
jgi:hypothetical protein